MSSGTAKLYGVSVGPGDPELLTLKAVRALRAVDVIAAPNTGNGMRTALGIVSELVVGKPVIDCSAPMTRDRATIERAHRENAEKVCAVLDEGKSVAFVTIGDVTVYSTYFYLHALVAERGYETEVLPGVTSFCAAAARLGLPLCEGAESLHVVSADDADLDTMLALPGTKVIMKAGKSLPALRLELGARGLLDRASLVVNCGRDGERVYHRLADAPEDLTDYFALVILRQGEGPSRRKFERA